jgi:hypothetical protein
LIDIDANAPVLHGFSFLLKQGLCAGKKMEKKRYLSCFDANCSWISTCMVPGVENCQICCLHFASKRRHIRQHKTQHCHSARHVQVQSSVVGEGKVRQVLPRSSRGDYCLVASRRVMLRVLLSGLVQNSFSIYQSIDTQAFMFSRKQIEKTQSLHFYVLRS